MRPSIGIHNNGKNRSEKNPNGAHCSYEFIKCVEFQLSTCRTCQQEHLPKTRITPQYHCIRPQHRNPLSLSGCVCVHSRHMGMMPNHVDKKEKRFHLRFLRFATCEQIFLSSVNFFISASRCTTTSNKSEG